MAPTRASTTQQRTSRSGRSSWRVGLSTPSPTSSGATSLNRALGALKPKGSAASIATPELDLDAVLDNNITFHGVLIGDDGMRTRRLADLFARGVLRPHVSHVLPLEDAAQAHRILESGHAGGKVVLSVRPPD